MYIIKHEGFILLPLAYNEFCNDIESLRNSEKYAGRIEIDRIIDNQLFENIIEFCSKDKENLYVIDMKHIISYEKKALKKLLGCSDFKIIIANIENNLFDSINEDLEYKYTAIDEKTLISNKNLEIVYKKYHDEIHNIYHEEAVLIVNWMKQNVKKSDIQNIKPLDSSGVYCNMYINAKRLFTDPSQYCFIIYQMICMIMQNNCDVDALVSASRNGANIASVIGWLLNKKVIHCTNLGPKFSLAAGSVYKDIRRNRKYIYIFDFMCLGTEAKLLNTLLSFKGAVLIEGYGIANYINLEANSQFSVFGKIRSLVDVQREKIGYRIAGSKEEIEGMLIEEDIEYASRVYRV